MITIGVDLIKINRIKKIKKLEKIFTPNELEFLAEHNYNKDSMAGIYAAKEATLKSLKVGLEGYSLLEIEILHSPNGSPYLNFYGQIKKEIAKYNYSFDISISHDDDFAIANVICYKKN